MTTTTSTDTETVAALLAPHFTTDRFTVAPGEKDGDVIVRSDDSDARWLLPQYAATLREAGVRVSQEDSQLTAQLWPFDARRDDPLTALRIPVVRSPYPGWKYEVCVVICEPGSPDDIWSPALRPDEAEVRMIAAELEWRMRWYNDGWRAKMRRRPLDVDGGTNTVILQKFGEGDWRYRRMTFQTGTWPYFNMQQRFTLEQLLDHINDYGSEPNPKWRAFKAEHPEAFPEPGEDGPEDECEGAP